MKESINSHQEELFKIHVDGVDVKDVMKNIRENIAKKKFDLLSEDELDEYIELNFVFQPLPGEICDELADNFASIESPWNLCNKRIFRELYSKPGDWNLDPNYKPTSHRKLSGLFILFIKRIISPFIRLYTDYVVYKQAGINHGFYNSIENLIREQGMINQNLGLLSHNLIKELTKTKLISESLEYNIDQLKSEIKFLKKREKALENLISQKN